MKSLKCCKLNFLQWRIQPKYLLFLLFLVLGMWDIFHGFRDYASAIGYPMRPWLLPLLPGMQSIFAMFLMGYLLIISDAPFRTKQQQFVLQRAGKRSWIAGQLLYLFLCAVLFTLILWILSWIFILPEVEWKIESWGSALLTAARKNAHLGYAKVPISYSNIKNAMPAEAMAWFCGMLIGQCFLMGEIVTLCNLYTRSGLGVAISTALILFSYLIKGNASGSGIYRFLLWVSPISWIDRSMLGHTSQYLPSFGYAAVMTVVLCLLLGGIIMGTIHRCNLDADKE